MNPTGLIGCPVSGVQEGHTQLLVCVEVRIEGDGTSTRDAELDERKHCGIVPREETVELETSNTFLYSNGTRIRNVAIRVNGC